MQNQQILAYLKKKRNKGVTAIEALEKFGCFRLAARIRNLRDDGHNIITMTEQSGNKRFARYVLQAEARG